MVPKDEEMVPSPFSDDKYRKTHFQHTIPGMHVYWIANLPRFCL